MSSSFDESYYLNAKLVQLQATHATDSAGNAFTWKTMLQAIADAGLTPETHYQLYGRIEYLNPNAYFNESEYLQAKLRQVHSTGAKDANGNDFTLETVLQAINDAGLTPAEHYEMYGRYETNADGTLINPSNAFDANAYVAAKLVEVQKNDPENWGNATPADVLKAIVEAGMSPVTHYMQYGATEANANNIPMVQTVPVSQRVTNDAHRDEFGDNVPSNYNPATPGPESNTAQVIAKPADVGGLAASVVSPPVTKPSAPVVVPGDTGYVAPPANMTDTNDNPVVVVPDPSGKPVYGVVADDGKTINSVDSSGTPTTEVIGKVDNGGTITPVDPTPAPDPTPDPAPTPTPTPDPFALTSALDNMQGTSGNDTFSGTWVDGKLDKGTLQAYGSIKFSDTINSDGQVGTDTLNIDMHSATTWRLQSVRVGTDANAGIKVNKVVLTAADVTAGGISLRYMKCAAVELDLTGTNTFSGQKQEDGLVTGAASLTLSNATLTGAPAAEANNWVSGSGINLLDTTHVTLHNATITGGAGTGVAGTTGSGILSTFASSTATALTVTGDAQTSITGGAGTGTDGGGGYGLNTSATTLNLAAVAISGGAGTGNGSGGDGLNLSAITTLNLADVAIHGGAGTGSGKGGYGIFIRSEATVNITGDKAVTIQGGTNGNGSTQDGFLSAVTVNASELRGNLTLSGSKKPDTINGGSGDDVLDGRAKEDTINGGAGNDIIIGGIAKDTLTGGAGNDTFVFNKGDSNINTNAADNIKDFVTGTDKLQFAVAATAGETGNFAAATQAATNFNAAQYAANTAMSAEGSSIIYSFQWVGTGTDATGYLFVNNDTTNGADEIIILTGVTALAYTDIITAA